MDRSQTRTGMLGLVYATLMVCATASAGQFPHEFRTLDGTENNLAKPTWGSAGIALLRVTTLDYGDGVGSPAGFDRASAREISNAVAVQDEAVPNRKRASDFLWQWGQFLDHDIDLTVPATPAEPFDIPVPTGDPFFDPLETGTAVILLDRSSFTTVAGIRQQLNDITSYIDASNVYGSNPVRARELRTLDSTGRLKTSPGRLLPFNVHGFPNMPDANDPAFFLAGDVRANEHVGLTAVHTLFVREHNRWTWLFRHLFPALSGEEIYQRARAIVGAEMQAITYNEFLPVLLGPDALAPYTGYNPEVNASITNIFSTAAYRFGHSLLSPVLLRLRRNGQPIPAGNLALKDAFFNPDEILNQGIEPLLRGLASQVAQDVNTLLIDDVRNFLFGPPGTGGFDLAALNIQRGRDHGLPGYNQVRIDFGLPPAASMADISSDLEVQANLASVYDSVAEIDIWVGGLAEDHVPGALVGETFFTILKDQFERLRDGDRFWYERSLPPFWQQVVERRTLARIIRQNTRIGRELQHNVFIVP